MVLLHVESSRVAWGLTLPSLAPSLCTGLPIAATAAGNCAQRARAFCAAWHGGVPMQHSSTESSSAQSLAMSRIMALAVQRAAATRSGPSSLPSLAHKSRPDTSASRCIGRMHSAVERPVSSSTFARLKPVRRLAASSPVPDAKATASSWWSGDMPVRAANGHSAAQLDAILRHFISTNRNHAHDYDQARRPSSIALSATPHSRAPKHLSTRPKPASSASLRRKPTHQRPQPEKIATTAKALRSSTSFTSASSFGAPFVSPVLLGPHVPVVRLGDQLARNQVGPKEREADAGEFQSPDADEEQQEPLFLRHSSKHSLGISVLSDSISSGTAQDDSWSGSDTSSPHDRSLSAGTVGNADELMVIVARKQSEHASASPLSPSDGDGHELTFSLPAWHDGSDSPSLSRSSVGTTESSGGAREALSALASDGAALPHMSAASEAASVVSLAQDSDEDGDSGIPRGRGRSLARGDSAEHLPSLPPRRLSAGGQAGTSSLEIREKRLLSGAPAPPTALTRSMNSEGLRLRHAPKPPTLHVAQRQRALPTTSASTFGRQYNSPSAVARYTAKLASLRLAPRLARMAASGVQGVVDDAGVVVLDTHTESKVPKLPMRYVGVPRTETLEESSSEHRLFHRTPSSTLDQRLSSRSSVPSSVASHGAADAATRQNQQQSSLSSGVSPIERRISGQEAPGATTLLPDAQGGDRVDTLPSNTSSESEDGPPLQKQVSVTLGRAAKQFVTARRRAASVGILPVDMPEDGRTRSGQAAVAKWADVAQHTSLISSAVARSRRAVTVVGLEDEPSEASPAVSQLPSGSPGLSIPRLSIGRDAPPHTPSHHGNMILRSYSGFSSASGLSDSVSVLRAPRHIPSFGGVGPEWAGLTSPALKQLDYLNSSAVSGPYHQAEQLSRVGSGREGEGARVAAGPRPVPAQHSPALHDAPPRAYSIGSRVTGVSDFTATAGSSFESAGVPFSLSAASSQGSQQTEWVRARAKSLPVLVRATRVSAFNPAVSVACTALVSRLHWGRFHRLVEPVPEQDERGNQKETSPSPRHRSVRFTFSVDEDPLSSDSDSAPWPTPSGPLKPLRPVSVKQRLDFSSPATGGSVHVRTEGGTEHLTNAGEDGADSDGDSVDSLLVKPHHVETSEPVSNWPPMGWGWGKDWETYFSKHLQHIQKLSSSHVATLAEASRAEASALARFQRTVRRGPMLLHALGSRPPREPQPGHSRGQEVSLQDETKPSESGADKAPDAVAMSGPASPLQAAVDGSDLQDRATEDHVLAEQAANSAWTALLGMLPLGVREWVSLMPGAASAFRKAASASLEATGANLAQQSLPEGGLGRSLGPVRQGSKAASLQSSLRLAAQLQDRASWDPMAALNAASTLGRSRVAAMTRDTALEVLRTPDSLQDLITPAQAREERKRWFRLRQREASLRAGMTIGDHSAQASARDPAHAHSIHASHPSGPVSAVEQATTLSPALLSPSLQAVLSHAEAAGRKQQAKSRSRGSVEPARDTTGLSSSAKMPHSPRGSVGESSSGGDQAPAIPTLSAASEAHLASQRAEALAAMVNKSLAALAPEKSQPATSGATPLAELRRAAPVEFWTLLTPSLVPFIIAEQQGRTLSRHSSLLQGLASTEGAESESGSRPPSDFTASRTGGTQQAGLGRAGQTTSATRRRASPRGVAASALGRDVRTAVLQLTNSLRESLRQAETRGAHHVPGGDPMDLIAASRVVSSHAATVQQLHVVGAARAAAAVERFLGADVAARMPGWQPQDKLSPGARQALRRLSSWLAQPSSLGTAGRTTSDPAADAGQQAALRLGRTTSTASLGHMLKQGVRSESRRDLTAIAEVEGEASEVVSLRSHTMPSSPSRTKRFHSFSDVDSVHEWETGSVAAASQQAGAVRQPPLSPLPSQHQGKLVSPTVALAAGSSSFRVGTVAQRRSTLSFEPLSPQRRPSGAAQTKGRTAPSATQVLEQHAQAVRRGATAFVADKQPTLYPLLSPFALYERQLQSGEGGAAPVAAQTPPHDAEEIAAQDAANTALYRLRRGLMGVTGAAAGSVRRGSEAAPESMPKDGRVMSLAPASALTSSAIAQAGKLARGDRASAVPVRGQVQHVHMPSEECSDALQEPKVTWESESQSHCEVKTPARPIALAEDDVALVREHFAPLVAASATLSAVARCSIAAESWAEETTALFIHTYKALTADLAQEKTVVPSSEPGQGRSGSATPASKARSKVRTRKKGKAAKHQPLRSLKRKIKREQRRLELQRKSAGGAGMRTSILRSEAEAAGLIFRPGAPAPPR